MHAFVCACVGRTKPDSRPHLVGPTPEKSTVKMTLDCQNLATATQKMRDVEDDLILHPDKPREDTLADAVGAYRKEKGKTSRERQGKHERVVFRRQVLFLAERYGLVDKDEKAELERQVAKKDEPEREKKIYKIAAQISILKPTDLDIDAYLMTFDGKISSRKDNRANVMSFWRWVQLKKLRPDNIALGAAKIVSSREEKQEKGKRRPTFTEKERNDYMRLIQDPNAWCQGSETGKRTRCRRGGKDTLPRLDASRIRDGHGRLCHIRGR